MADDGPDRGELRSGLRRFAILSVGVIGVTIAVSALLGLLSGIPCGGRCRWACT